MNTIRFLIVALFLVSCQQHPINNKSPEESDEEFWKAHFLSRIESFSLPFNKDFSDTNTLFFACSASFDTSFLMQFRKKDSVYNGIIYEVMPNNRMGIDKFADGMEDTLAFQGFSFRMDSIQWNGLIDKTKSLIIERLEHPLMRKGCFDGTFYYIAYNKEILGSDNCGDSLFEGFSQYLKDSLLNQYRKRR
jgi:hypothetical protein